MPFRFFRLGRLQRKVLLVVSVIVIVPMLVAGWLAAEWVSISFEKRLEQWIIDAARANQNWLQAYQNDAVILGRVLADDPAYLSNFESSPEAAVPPAIQRISQELGINLIQVYTPDRKLVYSSLPVQVNALWERGQTAAVLKVVTRQQTMLAAVGITPIPRRGTPRYYLVLGSLLGQDFTDELAQLTGLKTRLYYREGKKYYDLFSRPGKPVTLKHLPAAALSRLEKNRKPYYSLEAENGQFRGLYIPIVDPTGRVEAIMFSGLERRGVQEVLTNRIALFFWISLLGVIIGGLTGLLLSRLVVRPLEYLRNGVMQLAGQNFKANVPITSDDELGDLAKAFNAMATRLREARDEQVQRFQKDKLSAMGELSASLAHEIRNPIGIINASAALLDKPDYAPEKKAELTRMIREESLRVANLVQDFLQLSRHRQPSFAVIDPAQPLERALELALAGNDSSKVFKDFQHWDAKIKADAGLLQQAWGNIFTNALQALNGKETEFCLRSGVEDGHVFLSVEDNGPGVPAEIMPRLFEPFFTTKDQGTGLGLTLAYTLVQANGGQLEALPPEGKGARFMMRFPVSEEGVN
ncbi:MAG: ATP-binding protein [Gammaproteobacteria bacterium]|nr:ATP-binding protein [Gammaproteobacteria bacterium]